METLILKQLITNEEYAKKIIPFIKTDYFEEPNDKRIITVFLEHTKKYSKIPTFDEIIHDLKRSINSELFEKVNERIKDINSSNKEISLKKLVDDTEQFFKDSAIQNAIIKCATELEEDKKNGDFSHFPSILKEALAVCFDSSIGIEYLEEDSIRKRFKSYIEQVEKIQLGSKLMNYITDGGFEKKTLNIYIAPTNVGKTWKMIDDTANLIKDGNNVLYITLEMSENKIMQRVEANLFEVPTKVFKHLDFKKYVKLLKNVKANEGKKMGRLFVKDFPTSSSNVGHFEYLLEELEIKKNFKPDVIVIDYLQIMQPQDTRYANGYEKFKNISEELRRIAVEYDLCIITAVQTNRSGYSVSDFDLRSSSESIAVTFTADCIVAIIRDEDLDEENQVWIKVLKNRYTPIVNKKFTLGCNIDHQKFFDVDQDFPGSDFTPEAILAELEEEKRKEKDFSAFKF